MIPACGTFKSCPATGNSYRFTKSHSDITVNGNIDSTIIAQAPKLAPHVPAMRERIAQALQLGADAVNVKAKTAEKMGPVGEGRAIEARAVCLLQRA